MAKTSSLSPEEVRSLTGTAEFQNERTKVIAQGRAAYYACAVLGRATVAALLRTREEGNRAADLVQLYSYARTVLENINDALKAVAGVVDELGSVHIPEAYERENLQTLTTTDGDRLTVITKMFASLPADKREAGFEWLRANGHDALIVETINASSLSAFAKAEIAEGRELPDDIFTTHIKPSVTLTRGKGTKAILT